MNTDRSNKLPLQKFKTEEGLFGSKMSRNNLQSRNNHMSNDNVMKLSKDSSDETWDLNG